MSRKQASKKTARPSSGAGAVQKVLVANRGEIAVRIIRTLARMGISSVAVYSDPDRFAAHVVLADEASPLGGATPAESYLRIDRVLSVARRAKCDAVHPGYGFLAENADFAEAVKRAGLTFIGPTAKSIRILGDKLSARRLARRAGIPTVPGAGKPAGGLAALKRQARAVGLPVLVKSAHGGGGKGMRAVYTQEELDQAFQRAQSEARASFGRPEVYVERLIEKPRHIEIQVLADTHGNVVHLGERECSVQRRHQKLIEESPSPFVDENLRRKMGRAAVAAARAAGYHGAGTVEFLVDPAGAFYFLEVNTRLQVEHPVTEMVTGLDLVEEQVRVARGKRLRIRQKDVQQRGWSVECRIVAEDPHAGFAPSSGRVLDLAEPAGPGVRVDSALRPGDEITPYYDPMISKLITWGRDRPEAMDRMRVALAEYRIVGVDTSIPFHLFALTHPAFLAGDLSTDFVERYWAPAAGRDGPDETLAATIAALLEHERRAELSPAVGSDERSLWRAAGVRSNLHRAEW